MKNFSKTTDSLKPKSGGPADHTAKRKDKKSAAPAKSFSAKSFSAMSLYDFLRASPLVGVELDLTRERSEPRKLKT